MAIYWKLSAGEGECTHTVLLIKVAAEQFSRLSRSLLSLFFRSKARNNLGAMEVRDDHIGDDV